MKFSLNDYKNGFADDLRFEIYFTLRRRCNPELYSLLADARAAVIAFLTAPLRDYNA